MDAWGGISSLQLGLSSVWTTGADYGISLIDVNLMALLETKCLCWSTGEERKDIVGL